MKSIYKLIFVISFLLLVPLQVKASNDTVKISIVGDCTLGEYKGCPKGGQVIDYYTNFGPEYFFKNVKDIFDNDDITFINLEGPLTNYDRTVVKKFSIKGETKYIDILNKSSIELCNISNNHIYDCGKNGFNETIELLHSNNIGYCGEGYNYTTNINNINITFFGYNGWSTDSVLTNKIKQDISSCESDIKIVEFHWGEERQYKHNKVQEELAHIAIDSGASLVVGSHPHVLQDTEIYNDKLIAYSLGNFCFGANRNPKDKDTAILSIQFNKDGTYEYEFLPCKISTLDNFNTCKPTPTVDKNDTTRIYNKLNLINM